MCQVNSWYTFTKIYPVKTNTPKILKGIFGTLHLFLILLIFVSEFQFLHKLLKWEKMN